ncbi:MAG: ROK family transcriptional regulator [Alphaproteobacteria bacterium]
MTLSTERDGGSSARSVTTGRGSKQSDIRAHNERLVLSLLRRRSGLTKAEIARMTGLSAQAVSVIMRKLEDDGLLGRGSIVRGRIGQPSTPMALKADGAFSIGVKIGRRSIEMVLIDFVGNLREVIRETYRWPMPTQVIRFIREGVATITSKLSAAEKSRIAGLGIASPFELWLWEEGVGAPRGAMDTWRTTDLVKELEDHIPFPIYLQNDATAACGAEFVFGRGQDFQSYLYLFIGFFIGGGVVLNGSLLSGTTGNAGAIGSFPLRGHNGQMLQLIDVASASTLEMRLQRDNIDPSPLWNLAEGWSVFPEAVQEWISTIAPPLAEAIVGACSIIDFPAVIIDGGFPPEIRRQIIEKTTKAIDNLNSKGIVRPTIVEGLVGAQARAVGGACLPYFDKYILTSSHVMTEATMGTD